MLNNSDNTNWHLLSSYYVPRTLPIILLWWKESWSWCKVLGFISQLCQFLCVNGKTHTSFPSLCLLIYKVGKMTSKESDKKQDMKTLLKTWYNIIFEDLPSWHLYILLWYSHYMQYFYFMTYILLHMSIFTYVYTHVCVYVYMQMYVLINIYSQLVFKNRKQWPVSSLWLTYMQNPVFIYRYSCTFYYPWLYQSFLVQ